MNDEKIHKIFPTPIFQFEIDDHETINLELSKYIYELYENDKKGIERSNVKGWHSKSFKFEKDNTPSNFVKSVHKYVKKVIISGYGWKYIPEKIGVTEMWAVINSKDTYNQLHNHTNSYLSAAYYVKAPKNSGNIQFYDPNEVKKFRHPQIEKRTDLSALGYSIKPIEGNLLIFPSYLYHSVEKNLSDQDRIVVSFNVDIKN
jgi:uncharacterized protein (TIGR02466 family)